MKLSSEGKEWLEEKNLLLVYDSQSKKLSFTATNYGRDGYFFPRTELMTRTRR